MHANELMYYSHKRQEGERQREREKKILSPVCQVTNVNLAPKVM